MALQAALPFLKAAAMPSLAGGAAAASLAGTGLAIGGAAGAGAGAFAPGAMAALVPASQGFKGAVGGLAAQGGKGFVDALFGSPKGLAAFGKGVTSLGQIAGLMIGGEKGKKVAQSAGMFGLVSGLAPDIAGVLGAFKDPNAGTPLEQLGIASSDDYLNNTNLKGLW